MCFAYFAPLPDCQRLAAKGHEFILECPTVVSQRAQHPAIEIPACDPLAGSFRLLANSCGACRNGTATHVLDSFGYIDCNWDYLFKKLQEVERRQRRKLWEEEVESRRHLRHGEV